MVHFKGIDLPSYFPIAPGGSWRLDCQHRELIIGKGMGRIHVPLDNVLYYSPEEYDAE